MIQKKNLLFIISSLSKIALSHKEKKKEITLTFAVANVAKYHVRRQRNACILPRGRICTEIFRDVGRHCDAGLQEVAEEIVEEKEGKEEEENEERPAFNDTIDWSAKC